MSDKQIESVAFRQANLKSERLRLRIVLGAISAAFLVRTVRVLMVGGDENVRWWLITLAVLVPFGAYELLMLIGVNRAYERRRELPARRGSATSSWRMLFRRLESCSSPVHRLIPGIERWRVPRHWPFFCSLRSRHSV